MKPPSFPGRRLVRLFAMPLALLALGIGSTGYAVVEWRNAAGELADATARRQQAAAELERARREASDLEKLGAALDQLRRNGLLDVADPVAWSERLDRIGIDLGLPPLEHPFRPASSPSGSGWSATTLNLRSQLAHEGQLPRLIDAIRTRAPALTLVRTCRIERPAGRAGLDAECEIDWLTLSPSSQP